MAFQHVTIVEAKTNNIRKNSCSKFVMIGDISYPQLTVFNSPLFSDKIMVMGEAKKFSLFVVFSTVLIGLLVLVFVTIGKEKTIKIFPTEIKGEWKFNDQQTTSNPAPEQVRYGAGKQPLPEKDLQLFTHQSTLELSDFQISQIKFYQSVNLKLSLQGNQQNIVIERSLDNGKTWQYLTNLIGNDKNDFSVILPEIKSNNDIKRLSLKLTALGNQDLSIQFDKAWIEFDGVSQETISNQKFEKEKSKLSFQKNPTSCLVNSWSLDSNEVEKALPDYRKNILSLIRGSPPNRRGPPTIASIYNIGKISIAQILSNGDFLLSDIHCWFRVGSA